MAILSWHDVFGILHYEEALSPRSPRSVGKWQASWNANNGTVYSNSSKKCVRSQQIQVNAQQCTYYEEGHMNWTLNKL